MWRQACRDGKVSEAVFSSRQGAFFPVIRVLAVCAAGRSGGWYATRSQIKFFALAYFAGAPRSILRGIFYE